MKRSILTAAILGFGLSNALPAFAVTTVNLCAGAYLKEMPSDSSKVPMWGYALANAGGSCPPVGSEIYSSPGPRITVTAGDPALTINLTNTLPRATSLVIPGTVKAMAPQFFTDSNGLMRVNSFDAEAAANGGTVTYTWDNLAPGSYLYHSGTHPQVQVQMGLYGALTHDFAASEAYQGVLYSDEIILFYSEIDPVIHNAIYTPDPSGDYDFTMATNAYSQTDMKSTIGYTPKYFLINTGTEDPLASSTGAPPTIILDNETAPLIRFFNAGQRIHVPTVSEGRFEIFAEDGKVYPTSRKQYTVDLPPLKTRDAILSFTGVGVAGGKFRLIDGAMALSNPISNNTDVVAVAASASDVKSNGTDNGMLATFDIQPRAGYSPPVISGDEPVAANDELTVQEGGSRNAILTFAKFNDTIAPNSGTTASILSQPKHGVLESIGGGDFNYRHLGGEQEQDSLVYVLTNSAGESSIAGIVFNIAPLNDAPVARDDTVNARQGQILEIRALQNDQDVDSSSLRIVSVDQPSALDLGALTALEQVILFEVGQVLGSELVSYTMTDSDGGFSSAMLHLNVTEATAATVYTASSGPGVSGGNGSGRGSDEDDSDEDQGSKPTAKKDRYEIARGQTLTIDTPILGLMSNDVYEDAQVNLTLVEYPEHGQIIEINTDGTFVYQHDGSGDKKDDFTYEIYNKYGSSEAKVKIKIKDSDEMKSAKKKDKDGDRKKKKKKDKKKDKDED